jgi:hypothetical protein
LKHTAASQGSLGPVAPSRTDDFDPVDNAARPLQARRDFLRDLLEVVGRETAGKRDNAVRGHARNIAEGQVAAPPELLFGLID